MMSSRNMWHTPPFMARRGSNLGSWQAQNESSKRLRGFQALDVMHEAVFAALDVQFFTLQSFTADAQRKGTAAPTMRIAAGVSWQSTEHHLFKQSALIRP